MRAWRCVCLSVSLHSSAWWGLTFRWSAGQDCIFILNSDHCLTREACVCVYVCVCACVHSHTLGIQSANCVLYLRFMLLVRVGLAHFLCSRFVQVTVVEPIYSHFFF